MSNLFIVKLSVVLFVSMNAIIEPIEAQLKQTRVPGIVLVKFDASLLPDPVDRLQMADISSRDINSVFEKYGFEGAEKVFKHFQPEDTLTISSR